MGKRLIRIYGKDIYPKINDLINKDIHIVLKNNVTIHGKITRSENGFLFLEDLVFFKHKIPYIEVSEIYLDTEAPY